MNPSERAEHDRLYPLRRSDESADAFLRRCIVEHRLSHEQWVETLRKKPELATEATCGMAYQQRAVHRYDEMFAALEEITEPSPRPLPTLNQLLDAARHHVMTDEEKEAQRQSWVRGEMALCESERGMTSAFSGFERAIEESRGQRWIPVEEKLPSDGERVLVWFREYPVSGVPQYRVRFGEICNDHWRPEGGNGNFDRYVTHWQPLADPPKGNENV